ncbi:MAG: oxygen-independent coproporphyrinogen III oxidase [Gammaproteobacteria bacterium]|nr:oxygen-independent coproporphyrinogen III oxidase [Gammaproteobacteria bacterium]
MKTLHLSKEQFDRYNTSGPRYTSYPTAIEFHERFTQTDYEAAAERSNQENNKPLSLYYHIPFCDTICFYCACNKIATKDRSKAETYLKALFKEIEIQAALYDAGRTVDQLHLGGGTPTFISLEQMQSLFTKTAQHFNLRNDDKGEYSIEIDPRECSPEMVAGLRKIGFNRLSLGVQDFDTKVQKAVNRLQPEQLTYQTIDAARANGFHSVSVDLIYGLPLQSVDSFATTLDKIIETSVDRISLFNYAHLPHVFKPQRRINEDQLPAAEDKLIIFNQSIQQLTDAGYVYIGMDHFAKASDPMTDAQKNGELHRNFQGYSTHAQCDMVAMGVSSISEVNNVYSQNTKVLEEYYAAIDDNRLPIEKGITLSNDDMLRKHIIEQLMCNFSLDYSQIEKRYQLNFKDYFSDELLALQTMHDDELLVLNNKGLTVNMLGRLLIRNICMIFDAYYKKAQQGGQRFSKVI